MKIQDVSVVSVEPDECAWRIADEMDSRGVGSVVVVDEAGAPIGIVTDRDLVRRVVAKGLDDHKTTARDVMSGDLVVGRTDEDGPVLLERMRKHGVRRLPIVEEGKLVALYSLDDVLGELSAALWNVSDAIRVELRETSRSTARRRRSERRAELVEEARDYLRTLRDGDQPGGEFRGFLDWLSRGPS